MGTRHKASSAPTLFDLEPEEGPGEDAPAKLFASIAIPRPVRREFTYAVPDELIEKVAVGCRVSVGFARRKEIGVVVALEETTELAPKKVQPLLDVLDDEPVVGRELLALTRWIGERYAASWGEAIAAVLPAALKRSNGSGPRRVSQISLTSGATRDDVVALETKFEKQARLLRFLLDLGEPVELKNVLRRLNLSESPARTLQRAGLVMIELVEPASDDLRARASSKTRPERLSAAQSAAVDAIRAKLDAEEHATFLLAGITGSGKTEVYLCAIEDALARGRTAIVLVPEIALTPQTVGWFQSRFGEVCVLHSGMTDAQRLASWKKLRRGEVRVVVGARSAIFAPFAPEDRIGVIVVDEEHEPSFKQESVPRYHARDVAVERARRSGAVCILGSATPSLESWTRANDGRYERLELPERVGGGSPPKVHVVDMRGEQKRGLFSRLLESFLRETLKAKEQAILFLNRRGFIPILWCPGCEESVSCDQCDTGLTFHRAINRMVCHSCCQERAVPNACPRCSRPGLRFLGMGSQRVESELAELFPKARIRRMDSDTMRKRQDYEDVLGAFERHEIDVLVGTQMIAKGLDFPRVTLVGIVSADPALHLPDFRASERTFQLIAQVAGRAGRGALVGRVVVQTRAPEQSAIRHGATTDYEAFAREESALRAELGYPPHGRLVRVLFEDTDPERVESGSDALTEALRADPVARDLSLLGPAAAPFSLLRGRHRRHLLVKAANTPEALAAFERAVPWLAERAQKENRPTIKVDVDPMSLL